jgi:TolA-binding protein
MRLKQERKGLQGAVWPSARRRRGPNAAVGLSVTLALVLGACATSGDVSKLDRANQVQNQRLSALEESSARELRRVAQQLEGVQEVLRSTEGRLLNLTGKVEQMAGEQSAMSDALERAIAQNRSLRHRLTQQQKTHEAFQTEQKKELDAVRLRLGEMEKVMKTSISHLPSKTKADRAFREAFTHMVSGGLDFAADKFGKFGGEFPEDARVPEAKYRAGQSFFLMRKYDHAIVPFFELVDKHAKHKLAVDARWMLARSLEETGDLKLARQFYAQLISENTIHKADATRRVRFINELYPKLKVRPGKKKPGKKK